MFFGVVSRSLVYFEAMFFLMIVLFFCGFNDNKHSDSGIDDFV